jgi:hypothetical protein
MLRRLILIVTFTAGMSIAAAVTLAAPAFAKGPSQARITGPGLARAIVLSGGGEPGQPGRLASLAGQTSLFTALFGAGGSVPPPPRLRTPPPPGSLGPRYTVVYTVPGVTPRPGEQFGRVRQELYPRAKGGPVIYTPPGQQGFGQALQAAGWLHGGTRLIRTLAQLGIPPRSQPLAAHPSAAAQAVPQAPGWLPGAVAAAAAIVAAALTGAALWLRRRQQAGRAYR